MKRVILITLFFVFCIVYHQDCYAAEKFDNLLFGIADNSGSLITKDVFDDFEETYNDDYIKVKKDGQYAIIGIDGNYLFPFGQYKQIHPMTKDLYAIKDNLNREYIINAKGEKLINYKSYWMSEGVGNGKNFVIKEFPCDIEKQIDKSKSYIDYCDITLKPANTKIYDNNAEKIFEGVISVAGCVEKDKIIIFDDNDKSGDIHGFIINPKGQTILPKFYDTYDLFGLESGYCFKSQKIGGQIYGAPVGKNSYYIVNSDNEKIIPFAASSFIKTKNKNEYLVKVDNKWGLYDIKKGYIFKPQFINEPIISQNHDWLILTETKNINALNKKVQSLYDKNLKLLTKREYKKIEPLSDNTFSAITFENDYDIIDIKGKILYSLPSDITKNKFRLTDKFIISKTKSNNYKNSKSQYSLYDFKTSKFIFENYYFLQVFNDFIIGINDGLFILYDNKYRKLREFKVDYDETNFDSGECFSWVLMRFVIVHSKTKDVLINSQGKIVAKYHKIDRIRSKLPIFDLIYVNKMKDDDIVFFSVENKKVGCINGKNKIIIPLIYDAGKIVLNYRNDEELYDYIALEKDGKWGIRTYDNKIVKDFIYDYEPLELHKKYTIVIK